MASSSQLAAGLGQQRYLGSDPEKRKRYGLAMTEGFLNQYIPSLRMERQDAWKRMLQPLVDIGFIGMEEGLAGIYKSGGYNQYLADLDKRLSESTSEITPFLEEGGTVKWGDWINALSGTGKTDKEIVNYIQNFYWGSTGEGVYSFPEGISDYLTNLYFTGPKQPEEPTPETGPGAYKVYDTSALEQSLWYLTQGSQMSTGDVAESIGQSALQIGTGIIGGVENFIVGVSAYIAQTDPEQFIISLRKTGRTEATEELLRVLFPEATEDDIDAIFGDINVPEFVQQPLDVEAIMETWPEHGGISAPEEAWWQQGGNWYLHKEYILAELQAIIGDTPAQNIRPKFREQINEVFRSAIEQASTAETPQITAEGKIVVGDDQWTEILSEARRVPLGEKAVNEFIDEIDQKYDLSPQQLEEIKTYSIAHHSFEFPFPGKGGELDFGSPEDAALFIAESLAIALPLTGEFTAALKTLASKGTDFLKGLWSSAVNRLVSDRLLKWLATQAVRGEQANKVVASILKWNDNAIAKLVTKMHKERWEAARAARRGMPTIDDTVEEVIAQNEPLFLTAGKEAGVELKATPHEPAIIQASNADEMIEAVSARINAETGGLTRGLDAFKPALESLPDADVFKVIEWARTSTPYVHRFFGGAANDVLRARGLNAERSVTEVEGASAIRGDEESFLPRKGGPVEEEAPGIRGVRPGEEAAIQRGAGEGGEDLELRPPEQPGGSRPLEVTATTKYGYPDQPDLLLKPSGEPLVTGEPISITVYRGTGRTEGESVLAEGVSENVLGDARYYAVNRKDAERFGPDVEEVTLTLNKPYIINSKADFEKLFGNKPLPTNNTDRLPLFREARQALDRMGYDSVVVNSPYSQDIGPTGESIKRLREVFADSQVIKLERHEVRKSAAEIADEKLATPQEFVPPSQKITPPEGVGTPNIGFTHGTKSLDELSNIDADIINGNPAETAVRLWAGAREDFANVMLRWWRDGNYSLRKQNLGQRKGDHQELTAGEMEDLFNAFHGEGPVPPELQDVYDDIWGALKAEEAEMYPFDPNWPNVVMAHPDYFPRGWKFPKAQKTGKGRIGAKPGFLKPRVDATFKDMRAAEFEPLSWNPYDMAALRIMSGHDYREGLILIQRLKNYGMAFKRSDAPKEGWRVPKVGPAFEGKPYISKDQVFFTPQIAVPNNIADAIESIYGMPVSLRIGGVDVAKALSTFGNVAKQTKLFISFFQHVDFAMRNLFGSFTPTGISKGAPLKVPGMLTRMAVAANIKAYRRTIDRMVTSEIPFKTDKEVTPRMVVQKGWMVGKDDTLIRRSVRGTLEEAITQDARFTPLAPLQKLNAYFQSGLFDGIYRYSQYYALENVIIPHLRRVHPNWTPEQIAGGAAEIVNLQYSTLGVWQSVLREPAAREAARTIFFSFNETEAWIRQTTGIGKGPYKRYWQEYFVGIMITLTLIANAINYISERKFLPLDRYIPVEAGNPYSPLPWGLAFNTKFMAPRLPWNGRNGEPIYLDIVGQADTAFRWALDPGGALTARWNVVPRAAWNQIMGKDFWGRELTGGVDRARQMMTDLFMPIGIGNVIEVARFKNDWFEDFFPEQEGRLGITGSFIQATGLNVRARQTQDMLDWYAKNSGYVKADGEPVEKWDDLEPWQKKEMENQDSNLMRELELRGKAAVERGGTPGYQTIDELDVERVDRGEWLVREFVEDTADMTRQDKFDRSRQFRDDARDLIKEIRDRKSQVDADFQLYKDSDKLPDDPLKKALVQYYDLFEQAQRESGIMDWEKFDELEAKWRAGLSQEQIDYVDRNTGLTDWGPLMQEYILAKETLADSGYYDATTDMDRRIFRFEHPTIEKILTGDFYNYKPIEGEAVKIELEWRDAYSAWDEIKDQYGFATKTFDEEGYTAAMDQLYDQDFPGFFDANAEHDAWDKGFSDINAYISLQHVIRDTSDSSKQTKWFKIQNVGLLKEGLEKEIWSDDTGQYSDYINLDSGELTQKGKGLQIWMDNQYQFETYFAASEEDRKAMLEDEDLRKALRKYEALNSFDFPDEIADLHVDYYETVRDVQSVSGKYTDYSAEFFMQDNDEYYQAWLKADETRDPIKFEELPDRKYNEILRLPEMQQALNDWADRGVEKDSYMTYLSANGQDDVVDNWHRLDAYKRFYPNGQIEQYVDFFWQVPLSDVQYSQGWAEKRYLQENVDLLFEAIKRGGLDITMTPGQDPSMWMVREYLDIKDPEEKAAYWDKWGDAFEAQVLHAMRFDKVPSPEVEALYVQYLMQPGDLRYNFRIEHPDLDRWGQIFFGWQPAQARYGIQGGKGERAFGEVYQGEDLSRSIEDFLREGSMR